MDTAPLTEQDWAQRLIDSAAQRQAQRREAARQRQHQRRQRQRTVARLQADTAAVQAIKDALIQAEQRRIARMATVHQEGMSYAEIAKVTGLSKSRVHQLLASLPPDQSTAH
jgi:DNA-directed RNA polymerase specialized sigma subunit